MCGLSVDDCEKETELRPPSSFYLELQEPNCHFKARIPSLSNQLSETIFFCLYNYRKHIHFPAENSHSFTKPRIKPLQWKQ